MKRAAITRYFAGEQAQGGAWIAVGLAMTIAMSIAERTAERAMVWPLGAVALIQIAAGLWLQLATDGRVAKLLVDPEVVARETKRMRGVVRTFVVLELLWLAGIAVGIGLAVAAAAMLGQDLAASRRAGRYLSELTDSGA